MSRRGGEEEEEEEREEERRSRRGAMKLRGRDGGGYANVELLFRKSL